MNNLSISSLLNQSSLDLAILELSKNYDFEIHPYFIKMRESCRQSFLESQLPFKFAVENFSCTLAAGLSKIDNLEARLKLAENVAAEHGLVTDHLAHKKTFIQFLEALGANPNDLKNDITANVLVFNHSINSYAHSQSPRSVISMLGIIEYLYIGISSQIAKHIHQQNWVALNSQRHYELHEVLDVEHARELFDIYRVDWSNERDRYEMTIGLIFGAEVFWTLYMGMSNQLKVH